MFIIIACSKLKNRIKRGKATDIYNGYLFKLAVEYARLNKYDIYILSSKYGLIKGDTIINNYDEQFFEHHRGPWPKGKGFFIGSRMTYFRYVPDRIKPLIEETDTEDNFGYGKQTVKMQKLLEIAKERD